MNQPFSLIVTDTSPCELEAAGLIQSTDYILNLAAAQGRNVARQRLAGEDAVTCERLREQLTRHGDQPGPRR